MARFIGRKKELEGLNRLLKKKTSSLVVIRGRRRIGKSRLAEEFSKSFTKSYFLTGLPPEKGVTADDQRLEFARQMQRLNIPRAQSMDWGDLFADVAEHCKKGRILVVLDEITWMGDKDPTFLPKLKTIWDTSFKKNSELVLLVSGSNSAWIEKNLLSSTGFLGRVSYQLNLKELPLYRCSEFWPGARIAPYEKFKLLAITGGVPRYLEEVQPDLPAEQNILSLCYNPTGILFHEFDQIFSDLFLHRNLLYKEIIFQIAQGKATLTEIAAGLKRSKSGDLSNYLNDLVEGGFLSFDKGWNLAEERSSSKGRYRICDNYIRYYLNYIDPYKSRIEAEKMSRLPKGWKSIMGLQFENLVCNNELSLFQVLNLPLDELVWSGPYYQTAAARREGCQIDYLIQTKYRVLYLCEIKFSEKEIPYSVIKECKEKERRLKVPKGFSLRHVLIHVNGVSERLEEADFFSNIIDFGSFLKLPSKE